MYSVLSRIFSLVGFLVVSVEASLLHNLIVVLRNGSSYSALYDGTSFPDVYKVFALLPDGVVELSLLTGNIKSLEDESLGRLKNLKILTVNGQRDLGNLPKNVFKNLSNLVEVDLQNNNIETVAPGAFTGILKKEGVVGTIHLNGNKLRSFPPFISKTPGLKEIHLDGNPIVSLSQEDMKNLHQLQKMSIRRGNLMKIGHHTFIKNENLVKLDLSQNTALVTIDTSAFQGATQLKSLNLSFTGISTLPYKGLVRLEELYLRGSNGIWTIENEVVQLPRLRYVEVPSSRRFLCCAFIYERKLTGYVASGETSNRTSNCSTRSPLTTPVTQSVSTGLSSMSKEKLKKNGVVNSKMPSGTSPPQTEGFFFARRKAGRRLLWFPKRAGFFEKNVSLVTPRSKISYSNDLTTDDFGKGGFLTGTVSPRSVIYHCENSSSKVTIFQRAVVQCVPGPDELRPCDDIMGNVFLSIVSWIVSLLALLSNAVVFTVLVLSRRQFTVTKFLITNLSFADMCLGLYLFIMICASTTTHGSYYNYVRSWQFGAGCKVAGFLAIFASQLSMLVLTVITIERYLAIVFAVYLNKRLTSHNARILCIGSWIASALTALLPLVGVNSYSQVAICLPFQTETVLDKSYIAFVLTFNTVLCSLVFMAYFRMYWVVRSPESESTLQSRNDSAIAKRMALLVFTDFACWAPIAVFGLFSAIGYSGDMGINVKRSKYLLVIFFPINSLCNPFLYALLTKSFRRELAMLLASCGICEQRAHEYTFSGSFTRRSKQNKGTGHSDTVSTFVSGKDSRFSSLKSLFRRTVLHSKVQDAGQFSPRNSYPLVKCSDGNGEPCSRNSVAMDESTLNGIKEGALPDFLNRNPHSSHGDGLPMSSDPTTQSLTPGGQPSVSMALYTRSESAISGTSEVGAFNDETVLINKKSKESLSPDKEGKVPRDHRL
uniref:Glycoproteine hormone-like GPCR n=1 Tax=Tripedalia cystophora TaxID=6141 RepID=A0A4D5XWR1_TRICY|nr:glycoproteine hormone-like GPCR [Tripedalia cystophora]